MRTQWNDDEDEALHGLPWIAQLVYLRGIRPYMDYGSGIVGFRRGISLKSLAEMLHIEPMQGRKAAGDPSQKAIRHALEMLEREGLIAKVQADRQLVFRLPLADQDSSVSEKRGRFGADLGQTKTGRPESSHDAGSVEMSGRFAADPQPEKRGTPPKSGIREEIGSANALVEFAVREPDAPAKSEPVESLPVRAVFDYWRQVMNHPQAKLDPKRRRAIAARLKAGYSVETLKQAVDGCKASPWHQGKNKDGRVYDDIELICRDAVRVEQFAKRVQQQQTRDSELDAWLNDGHDNVIEGVCRHV